MGKKGKWFGAMKKVFSPESKENKNKKSRKSKRWFGNCSNFDESHSGVLENAPSESSPGTERGKMGNKENDQSKHAYSVALASAVAAEAAAVAAKAAAEVVRLTTKSARFSDRSKEDIAAIRIQTAFRGFLARRALRALRCLVRLKALTNSNSAKRQAAATLSCMQTLARVQSQIRSRRLRMTEENQALQKQLQLKHERELEKQRMAEEWDTSLQSKEQIEASMQYKQEAAIRRERAMAYAFSHQWKNVSRANPMFMDPNNPQWGWSWMERWMAARPWETRPEPDQTRTRSKPATSADVTPVAAKTFSPVTTERPASSYSKRPPTPGRKARSSLAQPEDSRSDASLASTTPPVPSYMMSTESAKAKVRTRSLSGDHRSDTGSERGSVASISSARKRLSFPTAGPAVGPTVAAAGRRRQSGPPAYTKSSV